MNSGCAPSPFRLFPGSHVVMIRLRRGDRSWIALVREMWVSEENEYYPGRLGVMSDWSVVSEGPTFEQQLLTGQVALKPSRKPWEWPSPLVKCPME